MYFGDEKIRQMARSILPSKSRHTANDRALIHRSVRREVQQSLTSLLDDPELWDDGVAWGEANAKEIRTFVNRRRGADKLNHFQRWAQKRTSQLPLPSRLGALRSVLPAGLIGQHAITHLEQNQLISAPKFLREPWRAPKSPWMNKGELARLLRALLQTSDGHRALNRALRNGRLTVPHHRPAGPPYLYSAGPRRLQGAHDVLAFIDVTTADVVARDVVHHFLTVWKRTRDVAQAETEAVTRRQHPSASRWLRVTTAAQAIARATTSTGARTASSPRGGSSTSRPRGPSRTTAPTAAPPARRSSR